ncbi:NAD(P)-binding protein [Macrolepiota fuliginosa MF-IS2]|uniref:NAD(P)-binding protein n=1 Tax=Macrolepiota fuliginosa MF-IS2 TaxID=1400762 RepID=A0A9P5X9F5_9AGAR|nr:NAD(P)-binding protein [Macrolepiota fuliginosa MF-IS2]
MANSPTQLVWLITGTSSGLGRYLTIAALNRGDKVIATARARSLTQLDDLKARGAETLELDVTAPIEELKAAAVKAIGIYGKIDVIVNNAGYILVGAIEENTPEETLNQFNTNVFGALNVTRAFLPYMRERKIGTVIFMGSIGGWRSVPNAGVYAATKYAVRGISTTLHDEIAPLGLRSVCIDFGYFRTSFLTSNNRSHWVSRIEDYRPMSEKADAALQAYNGKQPGDPEKAVEVIVDLVRGEGASKGKAFPRSLVLGSDCFKTVKQESEMVLSNIEEWKEITIGTDF